METKNATCRRAAVARLLVIGLAVGVGFGCGRPNESGDLQPTAVASDEAAAGEVADGLFVWGHEVRSFRPCGSEMELWVVGAPEVMDPLVAEQRKLTDGPYQPVYVRLVGEVSGPPEDGFGADYDGTFGVRNVLEVRPAAGTDCPLDDLGPQ